MHHMLFAFLYLLWQVHLLCVCVCVCVFFLDDLFKAFCIRTALKINYYSLEQRADLFFIKDNKDNIPQQVKSWEGLLEELFIRLGKAA